MSHQIDPPSYREGDPLPRCEHCGEQSDDPREGCLNPECPSHTLCEWCREREAVVRLLGPTEDHICIKCAGPALRAMLAQEQP
mgnify:CR=1 FL=1